MPRGCGGMIRTPDPAAMFNLAYEFGRLWLEASTVIWLRSGRLMQGGSLAQSEAWRMNVEKWDAGAQLGILLATGTAGATPEAVAKKAIRHYRSRTSANRRRLSR